MRLLFVNRFFFPDHSATSQILTDLCLGLAARGHEVHVVTSRLRYDDPSARLPREEALRVAGHVHAHRVWTSRFGRGALVGRAIDYLTFYLSASWRLLRLADRNTILVAKTDPPMISVVAALVARVTGARLVNWTQDLFPEVAVAVGMRVMPAALARRMAVVRDWSQACAARNVAIGERMCEKMLGRGLAGSLVTVIHNWADGDTILPQEVSQANPLRVEWQLEGKFVVGYSGNLGRAHEFSTVLDAAERLAERADIVFLFIGAGHQLNAIRGEAGRRGLANVRFRPYQPRESLAQSLGACDAHLVTLRPELEGLVVPSKFYGIIAAGRPVLFVGAGDGEIARLVGVAQCGAAFQVGDAQALAAGIGALADEPSRAHRWGQNGRRLFDARFAMPLAIDRWERLLSEVAQG